EVEGGEFRHPRPQPATAEPLVTRVRLVGVEASELARDAGPALERPWLAAELVAEVLEPEPRRLVVVLRPAVTRRRGQPAGERRGVDRRDPAVDVAPVVDRVARHPERVSLARLTAF